MLEIKELYFDCSQHGENLTITPSQIRVLFKHRKLAQLCF